MSVMRPSKLSTLTMSPMRSDALGQDHEAADVVGGQLLQAEADAHADGAAEHAERTERDAGRRQRQQQADQQQQRPRARWRRSCAPRGCRWRRRAGAPRWRPRSTAPPPARRTALSAPSIRLRKDTSVPPSFQWMASSSRSTSGSRPVTHSTSTPQTSQDSVRSSTRTACDVGNATRSTRTAMRITTSEARIGTARCSTATGCADFSAQHRAASANSNASTGNSTPSTMRAPNQTLLGRRCGSGPRGQPHDQPGQAEAAGNHGQLDQHARPRQRGQPGIEILRRGGHVRSAGPSAGTDAPQRPPRRPRRALEAACEWRRS